MYTLGMKLKNGLEQTITLCLSVFSVAYMFAKIPWWLVKFSNHNIQTSNMRHKLFASCRHCHVVSFLDCRELWVLHYLYLLEFHSYANTSKLVLLYCVCACFCPVSDSAFSGRALQKDVSPLTRVRVTGLNQIQIDLKSTIHVCIMSLFIAPYVSDILRHTTSDLIWKSFHQIDVHHLVVLHRQQSLYKCFLPQLHLLEA